MTVYCDVCARSYGKSINELLGDTPMMMHEATYRVGIRNAAPQSGVVIMFACERHAADYESRHDLALYERLT